jgi:hypothetical protein
LGEGTNPEVLKNELVLMVELDLWLFLKVNEINLYAGTQIMRPK